MNGYSIYVGGVDLGGQGWIVRVYRDADGEHLHSAERCPLDIGLREASAAIVRDMAGPGSTVAQRGEAEVYAAEPRES